MARRRATPPAAKLEDLDAIKLGQLLGQAWSGAKAIERRYPRVFAAALATVMELDDESARTLLETMEQEYVGVENAKHPLKGFR